MTSRRLIITTGDQDGIGLEISVKALLRLGPSRALTYFLMRSKDIKSTVLCKKLERRFRSITVGALKDAFDLNPGDFDLVQIISAESPAQWVVEAAKQCMKCHSSALVTAPLSKTEIRRAGLPFIGHTEILKHISKSKHTFMAFRGSKLNVVLATGHVSLRNLRLSRPLLRAAVLSANAFRQMLPKSQRRLPIGVVGLNPHAGEKGLIGAEESGVFSPVLRSLVEQGYNVSGPLVPDVIFAQRRWRSYSVLVATYHDQGLIPFKMLHGFEDPGVHLTLGIPFVRTSVDHGTAKDLFGKNRADPRSMLAAIKLATEMVRKYGIGYE